MYSKTSNGVKKILFFITQSEFGGAQRYVFDLALNLKNYFEVAVVLGEQANNGKLAKILQKNNIKYFIIPRLKRRISCINDLLALFKIIRLIKNYRPDIIHLNSSKISILGSVAAFITKLRVTSCELRVIYTVHGWVFNEPSPIWQKYFYLWAEKFTAKFKDKIICVSEYDRQAALRNKITTADKLITIHNGISPINFYSREEARQKINNAILKHNPLACHPGLDPGSKIQHHEQVSGLRVKPAMTNNFFIGSIGNLYKTKGYEYLIEAASILLTNPDLSFPQRRESKFIIIGDGSERKKLESLIKKYHLESNFILTGRLDDAAELLPALDLYVCSSVKEGLPYSILEAMSAGLPIISTNVGGIPEMIGDKKTGLLVGPADPNDLAEKIKSLINDKALRQELGARAKEKVTAEFGLEKMIVKTKEIYK